MPTNQEDNDPTQLLSGIRAIQRIQESQEARNKLRRPLRQVQDSRRNFRIRGQDVTGNFGNGYCVRPPECEPPQAEGQSGGGFVPPPTPTGACCRDSDCTIETQESCEADGGIYQGDDTVCEPNPCEELAACECMAAMGIHRITITVEFTVTITGPLNDCCYTEGTFVNTANGTISGADLFCGSSLSLDNLQSADCSGREGCAETQNNEVTLNAEFNGCGDNDITGVGLMNCTVISPPGAILGTSWAMGLGTHIVNGSEDVVNPMCGGGTVHTTLVATIVVT